MNKTLTTNLMDICTSLGYKCSTIRRRERKPYLPMYSFYMHSLSEFYRDYVKINSQFPPISLTFKERQLEFFIHTLSYPKGKPSVKSAELRKEKLLCVLKTPLTNCEIAEKTLINPRSVRRFLLALLNKKQIIRIKQGQIYYYLLKQPI